MDSKINRVETIPYSCPAVQFGYFLCGAVPFVSDRRVCSSQRELLPGSGCTYTRKRRSEERGKRERGEENYNKERSVKEIIRG